MGGSCPSFPQPWDGAAVHADFAERMGFFDSVLLDTVLSEWEADELRAQRNIYRTLIKLGPTVTKAQIVDWLGDALAEHLTRDIDVSKAYSLAHMTLLNELTHAAFNA
jgi:hypothetical protein